MVIVHYDFPDFHFSLIFYWREVRREKLKEYDRKDYLSFQKKGVEETNILQLML